MSSHETTKKTRKAPKSKGVLLNLADVYKKLCADVSLDTWSVEYLLRRITNEGLTFMTDVLPKFSKCVLASLEAGHWLGKTTEFRLDVDFEHKGALPTFFRSSLSKLFSPRTGLVRKRPSPGCLSKIRQICEYVYKLAVPYSEEKLVNAINKFHTIESEVGVDIDWEFAERVRAVGETLWPELRLHTIDMLYKDGQPRYGPGSFSNSVNLCYVAWEKVSPGVYKRLPADVIGDCSNAERIFAKHFLPYYHYAEDKPKIIDEPKVAEVVFVPKDSRGPRVISKEPLHLLRAQLMFLDTYSGMLEKVSQGRINFADQRINRELAQQSSKSREYATLDLADASDRVSFRLANTVFRNFPAWSYCLNNYRSTEVVPPGSKTESADVVETIRLKKLSGMGSGLTFVTMSALIHLGIVAGVTENNNRRTKTTLEEASRQIYVYGDDVIVPSRWYAVAVKSLTRLGLKVSLSKSFVKGNFRESCGGDYLLGIGVSPCRMKLTSGNPEQYVRLNGKKSTTITFKDREGGILAMDRHAREMYQSGYWQTAELLWDCVEQALDCILPVVTGESAYLGRWRFKVHYPHNYMEAFKMGEAKHYMPAPVVETSLDTDVHKAYGNSLSRPAYFSTGVNPIERANNLHSNELDSKLKRSFLGYRSWVEFLGAEPGSQLPFSEVALPNKVKLVKRKAYLHTLFSV